MYSNLNKSRKVDKEGRVFNVEWSVKYFIAEINEKIVCLICNEYISVRKEYNIRRHYETKHAAIYSKLCDPERLAELERLKRTVPSLDKIFQKITNVNKSASLASLKITNILAKLGKPFTDGNIIKSCLLTAVEELCPEQFELFHSICLSPRSIARRIDEIGNNITDQLVERTKAFKWFSLALDESTDITDTAQLLIFIRGISAEFEITEELASLNSINGTTKGENIFLEVEKTLKKHDLKWNQLKSITTDGGKNVSGTGIGLIGHIFRACEEANCNRPLVIHCIIHQQALCGKYLNMASVIEPVVATVNFIRARGLNHREFRNFLLEIDAEYPDLPYHTAVRWLSKGKVLKRFFELRAEIDIFLKEKNNSQPLLSDNEWIWKLAFTADILSYLNEFNLKLQGKTVLISEIYSVVISYRRKFKLFETQVSSNIFDHFPCCKSIKGLSQAKIPIKFAVDICSELNVQLEQRFADLDAQASNMTIFENPFNASIEKVRSHLQLEIIDLQSDNVLKAAFKENQNNLVIFYKNLSGDKYPELKSFAAEFISIFGSTYLCEQTFSKMKYVKSQYRSTLTDENLQTTLKVGCTNFEIDYDKILSERSQFHSSH
ncbi:hypothetical protein ENBRE01_1306 [Enteropsectra breve]|nr:hypothetical protein ENBRE01_1306 [Enteropsectra breve]